MGHWWDTVSKKQGETGDKPKQKSVANPLNKNKLEQPEKHCNINDIGLKIPRRKV